MSERPVLCDVLNVEPDEKFSAPFVSKVKREYWIDSIGLMWATDNVTGNQYMPYGDTICTIIQHREKIEKIPISLTEAELAICKAVGANFVSRETLAKNVELWIYQPRKIQDEDKIFFALNNDTPIAKVDRKLFPSVKIGDCIEVKYND